MRIVCGYGDFDFNQRRFELTKCIDSLTLGDIKELKAFFGNPTQSSNIGSSLIGQYVIARCYSAGVHAGTVESVDGENVILRDSRRLWNWKAKEGVALSGVAQTGLQKDCKVDVVNPTIYLSGVCELIPCSAIAKESINAQK